jgi:hypothetical protein
MISPKGLDGKAKKSGAKNASRKCVKKTQLKQTDKQKPT